ncbi:Zn-ribbon domain-containing OB-fold protein [Nocardioides sp. KR10-350]|uniref:Zn-ribbon domain-containing OB-fold protein n=1 Tax=Nocardioides cheoyonin TaxID=3156615 RepID=UPI0032B4DAB1
MHEQQTVTLPIATAVDTHYDGLAQDQLLITRCGACGRFQFPPRAVCYGCSRSGTLEWVPAAGTGEVWSYVTFHKAYFPPEVRQVPYTVAVVQLDEGPRLITNLVDTPDTDISIGARVTARFIHEADQHLVVFAPAADAAAADPAETRTN